MRFMEIVKLQYSGFVECFPTTPVYATDGRKICSDCGGWTQDAVGDVCETCEGTGLLEVE